MRYSRDASYMLLDICIHVTAIKRQSGSEARFQESLKTRGPILQVYMMHASGVGISYLWQ